MLLLSSYCFYPLLYPYLHEIFPWYLQFSVDHMATLCLVFSVQFSSVAQSCPTFSDSMDCSTPDLPVHHQLLELPKPIFIELVMPSNHLILCHLLLLLPSVFPSIRIFSSESILHISWPKYWSFSFSISPFIEYLGLTGLISLQSKGLSRVFSITTVQKHHFFGAQPSLWSNSHPYMTTGKTIALQADSLLSEPPGKPHKQLWTVFMQT